MATKNIISSQVSSILFITLCVFILILFLYRDFKIACLALIPNLFPILFMFGIMGLFDIYLDVGTCNVAAVAIGIAADDTLHFLARMEQNVKIYFDKYLSIQNTILEEIRPISCTSISLSVGLSMLGFSTFVPLIKFGLLISLVICIAYVADIIITPILMSFVDENKFISLVEIFRYRISPHVLKTAKIFRDIEIKVARKMILNGKIIEIEKHQNAETTQYSNSLFFIIQGNMQVYRNSLRNNANTELLSQDNKIILANLSPGEIFGELENEKRLYSDYNIQALNHCKLLIFNPKFIDKLKNNFPDWANILERNIDELFETKD